MPPKPASDAAAGKSPAQGPGSINGDAASGLTQRAAATGRADAAAVAASAGTAAPRQAGAAPHVSRPGDNETSLAQIPIVITIIITAIVLALCYPAANQWERRLDHNADLQGWTWRVPPSPFFNAADSARKAGGFIGREEELKTLLSVVRGSTGQASAHILGAQGIGKSSLVAEFVRRANTDPDWFVSPPTSGAKAGAAPAPAPGPLGTTLWLRATSLQLLASELKTLADHLGLRTPDLTLHAIADRVAAFLYKQPTWLVVLDDVIDERVLQVIPALFPRLVGPADKRPPSGPVLTSKEAPTNGGAIIVISPSLAGLNPMPGTTLVEVRAPSKEEAKQQLQDTIPPRVLLRGTALASTEAYSAASQGAISAALDGQLDLLVRKLGPNPTALSFAAGYLTTTTASVAEYLALLAATRTTFLARPGIGEGLVAAALSKSLASAALVAIHRAEQASPLASASLALMAASSPVVTAESTNMWAHALANKILREALMPPRDPAATADGAAAAAAASAPLSTAATASKIQALLQRMRALGLLRGPYPAVDGSHTTHLVYHTPLAVQLAASAHYATLPPAKMPATEKLPDDVTTLDDGPRVLSRLDIAAQCVLSLQASRIRTMQAKVGDAFPTTFSAWELADHESVWVAASYDAAAHLRAAADVLAPSPLLPHTPKGGFVVEARTSSLGDGPLAGLSNLASFTAMVLHRPESSIRFSDLARSRGHPLPLQVVPSPENAPAHQIQMAMTAAKDHFTAAALLRMSRRLAAVAIAHMRAKRKTAHYISAVALELARYALVAPDNATRPLHSIATTDILTATDTLAYAPELSAPIPASSPASAPETSARELLMIPEGGLTTPLPVGFQVVTPAMRRDNLAGILLVRSIVLCDCGTRLRQPPIAHFSFDMATNPPAPANATATASGSSAPDQRMYSSRAVVAAVSARRREVLWGMTNPALGQCDDWEAAKALADEAVDLVWGQGLTPRAEAKKASLLRSGDAAAAPATGSSEADAVVESVRHVPTPLTSIALTRMAMLYERKQRWDDALTAHQYALQSEILFFSERSVPVFRHFAHIAAVWYAHSPRREREAASAVYKAYSLAKQLFDEYDPRLSDALSALGKGYMRTGNAVKAIKQFEDAAAIEVEAGGEFHERTLARLVDYGQALMGQQMLEKALLQFHRVARALEAMLGPHTLLTQQWNSRCVALYQHIRELARAAEAARAKEEAEKRVKAAQAQAQAQKAGK